MTKLTLIKNMTRRLDCSVAHATDIYDDLINDIIVGLRTYRSIVVPGLVKLTIKSVAAKPEHTAMIGGKAFNVAAKPESKRVAVKVLKPLTDAVNHR